MKAFNAYIFIEFYLYKCIDALKLAALYMRSFAGIDIDRTYSNNTSRIYNSLPRLKISAKDFAEKTKKPYSLIYE